MCMIDDGERYELWGHREIKKSRKEHVCCECSRAIKVGESYRVYWGLYDGEWQNHPTCQHCLVACEWLAENCHGFLHGGVYEDIEQHADEYHYFGLYRLEIGMRRKWKDGLMRTPKIPKPISITA